MFKLGDHVGVKLREETHYGEVIAVDGVAGALSIKVSDNRVAQVRACDCFVDEGYKALKEQKFVDNTMNYDSYGNEVTYD